MTDRNDRPINRWISWVLPPTFPFEDSRCERVWVALGSMEYSAVTQPVPFPRKNGGTLSPTDAAQMTLVSPNSIKTDPSACLI
jgi:hypothetical protein